MNVLFYAYGAVIGFAIGLVAGIAFTYRSHNNREENQ
jgi:cbb3-type cytochrome oxidase subunit 3